jgi:hypothetical protein
MGVMAIATSHVAMLYRMSVWLQRFGALLLVTIETNFRLCSGRQYGVVFCVADMTIRTRDAVVVMTTAVPRETRVTLVAIDAKSVLFGNGCYGVRAKPDDRRTFLATSYPTGVRVARSVTGLTL